MKILVPIKRVIDAYAKIRVKTDQTGVETSNVKMAINPFDEIAIEQALQFKEKGLADEVVVVSVGEESVQEQCRTGLALGADRAVLVTTAQLLEPLNIAKVLHSIVIKEQAKLVIMGKQSIDGDHNQTGQMLAALLDWPQATYASKIELNDDLIVQREIDGGLETLKLPLPAVVTTDLRLNTPRYASLPSIMKAKQKPLELVALDEMNLDLGKHIEVLKVEAPKARSAGEIVPDTQTLIDKLKQAKVI